MYNYHKFLQDTRIQSHLKTLSRQYRCTQQLRAERSPKMVHNHDKRVEHSILDLLAKPILVNNYKDPSYLPRKQDPSKRVVTQEMFYAYEQQPMRIAHSLERNASLDLVPFRNPTFHHFRQPSPAPPAALPRNDSHPNLLRKDRQLNSKSTHLRGAVKGSPHQVKERLPLLQEKHHKTYFHTLETIVNKADSLPTALEERHNASQSSYQMGADSESFVLVGAQNINRQKSQETQKNKIEKIKKCRQVLEKCGLLPPDSPHPLPALGPPIR